MNYIEITKKQLLALLFEGEIKGSGMYGILKEINPTILAKIYYKEVFDTYQSKDPSKLDKEIEMHKSVHQMVNEIYSADALAELERLEQAKLQYLFEIGLLKGILVYKGYKIGVLLNYYRDYDKLTNLSKKLSVDDLYFVMKSIKLKLTDMMNKGLFPRDLKEDNILVRQKDLDVVIIDLDDSETRFEEIDYILTQPHIKMECLERYNKMKKRVCQR